MPYLAPATIILAILHHLSRWADRRHAATRDRAGLLQAEQARHEAQIERLLAAHGLEVQALCQRLQAPEQAVIAHQVAVAPDDQPGLPMRDIEIAEAEQQQLLERIAAMERAEPLSYIREPFNGGQPTDGVER